MFLAVVASLTLYIMDARLDYFAQVRSLISSAVYPVQVAAGLPADFATWLSRSFQGRDQLQERIRVLEASQQLMSARLQRLQALERENLRLRELLGSSFRLQERIQIVQLLAVDSDPFSQQVVLDKGQRFGVYVGQPVLDAHGVMGQVSEVNLFSSRVVLVTDPNHSIPVQINRNGLRGVVFGRGPSQQLKMDYMPHNADVRVGDLVVTSGLGGIFPAGYPVGVVTEVNLPTGKAFADIAISPAAHLGTTREVMLVLPGETIDFDLPEPSVQMPDFLGIEEIEAGGVQ